MRLLVIEDEPRIAEILRAPLEQAGFAVDFVRLRAEGQAALALHVYDAAILDRGLPDGDGLKLIAELIARTKALLRRPGGALGLNLKAGNVQFDTVGRDVHVNHTYVQLPRRE